MAELAPRSDRTKGIYARVHAAQKLLPALVFVSPDFSAAKDHPEHFLQYYSNADIIKLPLGDEKARAAILNRIELAVTNGEKLHTIFIHAHGGPDTAAIGGTKAPEGEKQDRAETFRDASVEKLLGDIAAIRKDGKPIASQIILSSCDVLADASPEYLDRLSAIQKKLGANIIASVNTAYTSVSPSWIDGKYWLGDSLIPAAGRYYQITKGGHFVPYFNFRDEKLIKQGDKITANNFLSMEVVEKRAAADACSDSPSASCSTIKKDYDEFAAYTKIRHRLNNRQAIESDQAGDMVKILESMAPKAPEPARIGILKDIMKLSPLESPIHKDALDQSLGLIMSGALHGDADSIKYHMTTLSFVENNSAFESDKSSQFVLSVAQKLSGIQGLPTEDQIKVWNVTQDWKKASPDPGAGYTVSEFDFGDTAKESLLKFEHALSTKVGDKKYPLIDRAKIAKLILSSDSDNPQLTNAASVTVCEDGVLCSAISSVKHFFAGKSEVPTEQIRYKKHAAPLPGPL